MITQMLAETPVNDTVSLGALGAFLVAVGGMVITYLKRNELKSQGAKEERQRSVTITDPIPKVRTQEEPEYVTNETLNGHLTRLDASIREIKETQVAERGVARQAQSNVHQRLDKVMENQALSRGELSQISLNVQRLLDRTDGKHPPAAHESPTHHFDQP